MVSFLWSGELASEQGEGFVSMSLLFRGLNGGSYPLML